MGRTSAQLCQYSIATERTHAKMQPDINSKVKTERGGRHDVALDLCLPLLF
jgi:hypothetical protein